MNGSVKHVVFGHAICDCGCLDVFTGASYKKLSSQLPCMCIGKLTCCFVSNDARISLDVVVVPDGVSR